MAAESTQTPSATEELVDALGDLVGHWNALAEEDADSHSPSGELSNNIAIAHGQSLAFGTAARELADLLEHLT